MWKLPDNYFPELVSTIDKLKFLNYKTYKNEGKSCYECIWLDLSKWKCGKVRDKVYHNFGTCDGFISREAVNKH